MENNDYNARDLVSLLLDDDSSSILGNLIEKGLLYDIVPICTEVIRTDNKHSWSVFTLAADRGAKGIVCDLCDLLVDCGADLDTAGVDAHLGRSALHYACAKGNVEIANFLLNSGSKVNNVCGTEKWTSIHYASNYGHTTLVNSLLDHSSDINILSRYGHTPLYLATQNGYRDTMKLLIKRGADYSIAFENERTLLQVASENGHLNAVKLLFDLYKADGDNLTIHVGSSLISAAGNDRRDLCQWLLSKRSPGVSHTVNRVDSHSGMSALHAASAQGHLEIIKILLKHEANINIVNRTDHRPIHSAACHDKVEVIKLLAAKGADWTSQTSEGHTILHLAVLNDHIRTTTHILSEYVDLPPPHPTKPSSSLASPALHYIYDSRGLLAIHLAALYSHRLLDPLLLRCRHHYWPHTLFGDNVLMLAAKSCMYDTVEYLSDKNPSLIVEANGTLHTTVLHYAAKMCCVDMLHAMLADRNIDVSTAAAAAAAVSTGAGGTANSVYLLTIST